MTDPVEGILYGLMALALLCLPALRARAKHKKSNLIFLLSLAAIFVACYSVPLGGLVWLAALIWAESGNGKNPG